VGVRVRGATAGVEGRVAGRGDRSYSAAIALAAVSGGAGPLAGSLSMSRGRTLITERARAAGSLSARGRPSRALSASVS
jgi:hypothetical protein